MRELRVSTERRNQLVDITREVREAVAGAEGAAVHVYVPHTSAGVTLNERIDPELVSDLADIFAFDLDFTTDVRRGDRFRLVVEQKTLDGRPAGAGRILAAEYVRRDAARTAVLYQLHSGESE